MSTLKPCPFCAAELRIRAGFNSYGHCPTDGCYANRGQIVPLDDERQVAAWNRRPALSPEAPAREVTDAMVEAACSRFVSESDDIWSASVWPEGLDDDGDRGDGGRVRLISEDDQHKIRAAMRFALQDALTPRHEAPAEGAGEAAIAKLFDAVEMADDYNRLSDRPKRLVKDFLLDSELRDAVSSLRARSSAPEAREGEAVAWKFRNLDLRQVGVTMDRREADRKAEAGWEIEPLGLIVQPAAPSADKLRIAVEALESAREDLLRFACARGSEWEGSLEDLTEEVDQALTALNAEG